MRHTLCLLTILLARGLAAAAATPGEAFLELLRKAPTGHVVNMAGQTVADPGLRLTATWTGASCRATLANTGTNTVSVREVVLFDVTHALPPETPLYGEGFSMVSCTVGTLGHPVNLLDTDGKTFKLGDPPEGRSLYGMALASPAANDHVLAGFASCKRFLGKLNIFPKQNRLQVVLDARVPIAPGETWELEEFTVLGAPDRNALLDDFAARIQKNHPTLRIGPVAKGWCSWYCFGPGVTVPQISRNLQAIAADFPELRYIQIDDGWQPAMGDWSDPGRIKDVLAEIKSKGFEPALWVAPFVVSKNSRLFREHPEWMARGTDGQPVLSDAVFRGAWRQAPWYILDATHPGAQAFLEETFRRMRAEWGCTYFKLDANSWGACPNVTFHDPKATAVEAFRRGMEAILRGAGKDSFVLGCNSPLWPSLGLIHGNRASLDILGTDWVNYSHTARLNFVRNWQNDRLWWNDPDCLRVSGKVDPAEMMFHATSLYASGGMILSSDDIPALPPERKAVLKKLAGVKGVAARFDNYDLTRPIPGQARWEAVWGYSDPSMQIGWMEFPDHRELALFNWQDQPLTLNVPLSGPSVITDLWTGEKLGEFTGVFTMKDMPKHSARLLRVDAKR